MSGEEYMQPAVGVGGRQYHVAMIGFDQGSRSRVVVVAALLLLGAGALSLMQAALLAYQARYGRSSYSYDPWPELPPLGSKGIVAAGVIAALAFLLIAGAVFYLRGRGCGWFVSFVTGLLVLATACGCGGCAALGGAFGSSAADDWENRDPANNFDLPIEAPILRVHVGLAVVIWVLIAAAIVLLLVRGPESDDAYPAG